MADVLKWASENNYTQTLSEIKKLSKKIKINNNLLLIISMGIIPGSLFGLFSIFGFYNQFILLIWITLLIVILFMYNRRDRRLMTYPKYLEIKQSKKNNNEISKAGKVARDNFVSKVMEELPEKNFLILNRLFLPYNDLYLLEVGHIIIGPSGTVYVINVKNWRGITRGYIDDSNWFQQGKKRKNPYKQNKRIVESIENELDVTHDINIYNVVINVNQHGEFIIEYKSPEDYIFNDINKLLDWISTNEQNLTGMYPTEEQLNICDQLWDLHYYALYDFELRINEDILKKDNLYKLFKEKGPYFSLNNKDFNKLNLFKLDNMMGRN